MIIGITGKQNAGKSTLADILVAEHGFALEGFSFALKDMLYDLDPQVEESSVRELVDFGGWDWAKRTHPEVRRLLQVLGTDCIRAQYSEFWIDAIDRRLEIDAPPMGIVIADVRFDNEAQYIKDLGGIIVRVHRESAFETEVKHASELGICSHYVDVEVYNDSTKDELRKTAAEIVTDFC